MNKQQTFEQAFEELRAQVMSTAFFDTTHEYYPILMERVKKCIRFCSVRSLQCTHFTYETFVKQNRKLTMIEMNLAFEVMKGATPNELQETPEEYINFMQKYIVPVEEYWFKLYDDLTSPILARLRAQQKISQGVPENKRLFIPGQA